MFGEELFDCWVEEAKEITRSMRQYKKAWRKLKKYYVSIYYREDMTTGEKIREFCARAEHVFGLLDVDFSDSKEFREILGVNELKDAFIKMRALYCKKQIAFLRRIAHIIEELDNITKVQVIEDVNREGE